jgi:hypothetical protein
MHEVLWITLPFVAALGSGVISFIIAQARMEVCLSKRREALVEARATLAFQHKVMEERVKAAEAEARRKALDEFLSDVRVEERHYLKETQSAQKRCRSLVLQERIYFRNIPLSRWVEHEIPIEEEGDLDARLSDASVFRRDSLPPKNGVARKLLT